MKNIISSLALAMALWCAVPYASYAWRGHQVYTGASFGVQVGETYEIVSSNPRPPLTEIQFGSGFDFSGYIGYSLGDYIVVEGDVDFCSMYSGENYFKPGEIVTFGGSNGTSSSSRQTTTVKDGEVLQIIQLFLNTYLNLDTGSDFMPYVGAGFGSFFVSWSGYSSQSIGYQLMFGVDILLVPKMSAFLQIRRMECGDLDFETQHYVMVPSPPNVPINIVAYQKIPYSDTLKDVTMTRIDLGVRIAF